MMRLVELGLMYGNLFQVASPALVERYNRALQKLIGRQTSLTEFHVDLSGFSPEIGDELEDPHYLNPNGCNRQFIILSLEQMSAPLLNAKFSTSRSIIRDFIKKNEEQLFVLTTKDVVIGELVNSVLVLQEPRDVFLIKDIHVEADTLGSHVEASEDLTEKIYQFMHDEDAWWDDVLIAEMIELAKHTGDIVRSPVKLTPVPHRQENFHTSHFGGLYIFQDVSQPACISVTQEIAADRLPVPETFSLSDKESIAAFLNINQLVETLLDERVPNAQSIIKQKLDFIAVDFAASQGLDLSHISRRDLRILKRQYHAELPPLYHTLRDIWLALKSGSANPRVPISDPAYFYLVRSRHHADTTLVNMLLAELTPLDFRQQFICHKEAFYSQYNTWHEEKKAFVANFLAEEYLVDKVGLREELFGTEPALTEEVYDIGLGKNQGPWGAIPAEDD
ncbi:MAG: DUF6638 family protein [Roseibium sp.]